MLSGKPMGQYCPNFLNEADRSLSLAKIQFITQSTQKQLHKHRETSRENRIQTHRERNIIQMKREEGQQRARDVMKQDTFHFH